VDFELGLHCEEGDDLESMTREPTDYDRDKKVSSEGMAKPKESLVRKIKKIGVREFPRRSSPMTPTRHTPTLPLPSRSVRP
jgi:hypothetical protein